MENVLSGRLGYVPFWRSFLRRYPQPDVDKAFGLLKRVGLSEHVDKRADALSGGQRQRVGIARALEQDPELLLVDEPTASLDPKTSRQIMRLICEICAERRLAAVINIHDVALAGRLLSAIQARELDLVDEAIGPAELETRALAVARELGALGPEGYAQIKAALQAPALERIHSTRTAELERWLDSWFSPSARALLADAVARIKKK